MSAKLEVHAIVVAPLMENTYLVADQETRDCLVVDPGSEPERILAEIQRLRVRVALIVNTHGHVDHIGAVAALAQATGAPYAIHSADVPLLQNAGSGVIATSMFPGFQLPPKPDRTLADGDTLSAGGLSFTVLETPGHTPGSVCLLGHGIVLTGDTLFRGSIGRYDLPGGDGQRLMASIRAKLLPLPDETVVYSGHGPESTIGREKRYNPFLREGFRLP
ncbi:MAG: MBL fold metallo-hydrolase [Chloroflexota bacterium]|nr:MBL fold metallo-hydrolase [Chloroflexota bacterium]